MACGPIVKVVSVLVLGTGSFSYLYFEDSLKYLLYSCTLFLEGTALKTFAKKFHMI